MTVDGISANSGDLVASGASVEVTCVLSSSTSGYKTTFSNWQVSANIVSTIQTYSFIMGDSEIELTANAESIAVTTSLNITLNNASEIPITIVIENSEGDKWNYSIYNTKCVNLNFIAMPNDNYILYFVMPNNWNVTLTENSQEISSYQFNSYTFIIADDISAEFSFCINGLSDNSNNWASI